jgi:hypothetical protein
VSGALVVCPTPIGNLGDVTLRVLDELRTAAVIACEDTRRTLTLLDRHGIAAPRVSLTEHNEAARIPVLLDRMRAGERVALVSDAGTPTVSDPGARLVAAAVEAGLTVEVLPGASAVTRPGWRWWRSSRRGACRPLCAFWPSATRIAGRRSAASSPSSTRRSGAARWSSWRRTTTRRRRAR